MRLSFSQTVSLLRSGHVVGVPTETVYGLAACLDHEQAIKEIFRLKNRPQNNPLIIHLADLKDLNTFVTEFPPQFEEIAQAFWPGALTCILPINHTTPSIARSGLPTAGFRVPELPIVRQLIVEAGPLVMPSANISGKPSPTCVQHVEDDFGKEFPVLEGGICSKGLESTIIFYKNSEWVILRLGALPPEVFKKTLGYEPRVIQKNHESNPLCPGQLFRHYAPRARLILGDATLLAESDFILGFKENAYPKEKRTIILGSLSNPQEVAGNLYQALRQLDLEEANQAWVDMSFPRQGLWKTIAERLERAGNSMI